MKTNLINKSEYKKIVNALKEDKVVAFPTETVMGLTIRAFSKSAYNQLIDVKNRPLNKAFPFVVPNTKRINDYAYVDNKIQKIIDAFLPGPLTLILKKKDGLADYITSGKESIAIRIPDDEVVLKILNELNEPLLLTSANKSGENPALNSEECYKIFNEEIEYIIDGCCKFEEASTIVDLTNDEVIIVRQGKITLDEILKVMEG